MTNRIFIPSMIVGALLLTAIFAQAMSEPDLTTGFDSDESELALSAGHHGERRGHRLEMMATILDLSADQQEQIKQIFTAERNSHKEARQEMREARETMNALMHVRPFDETSFRSLAKQQADKRIDAMVARAKVKQQVFDILTPEQQEKADELWSLMGKKGKGKHRKGH